MKALQHRTRNMVGHRLEAALDACIGALFFSWPALSGFTVRERPIPSTDGTPGPERELYISDISVYPLLCAEQCAEIYEDISTALAELLDESPEAAALLRGRTFAWVLH